MDKIKLKWLSKSFILSYATNSNKSNDLCNLLEALPENIINMAQRRVDKILLAEEFKLNLMMKKDVILSKLIRSLSKSFNGICPPEVDPLGVFVGKKLFKEYNKLIYINKTLLIRSFLTPVIFLTNWIDNTRIDRLRRDVLAFGVKIYTHDYSKLYDIVKKFTSEILDIVTTENPIKDPRTVAFFSLLPFTLRKIMKNMFVDCKYGKQKSLEFLYSLNFMKKGMGPLLPYKMVETVTSTFEKLNKSPTKLDEIQKIFLKLAVQIICNGEKHENQFIAEPPTKKATFEYKSSEGGGAQRLKINKNIYDPTDYIFDIRSNRHIREYMTIESIGQKQAEDLARVALLIEANKLRFLTIQHSTHQAGMIDYQNFKTKLWSRTKFSTMDEGWKNRFESTYDNYDNIKSDVQLYDYSADYSDATNNMSSLTTQYIEECYTEELNIPEYDRRLIMEVIGPRYIQTDNIIFANAGMLDGVAKTLQVDEPDMERIVKKITKYLRHNLNKQYGGGMWQSTGQMMGNPLSFVDLCTVNLAVYLQVELEDYVKQCLSEGENVSFSELKELAKRNKHLDSLLINGDDAFITRWPLYMIERHKFLSQSYGLTVNSKTIISEVGEKKFTLRQANSVMYMNNRRVPYLNQALYYNYNIKNLSAITIDNIDSIARTLYEESPYLVDSFLRREGSRILGSNFNPLLSSISKDLGGLGCDFMHIELSRKTIFNEIILKQNQKRSKRKNLFKSVDQFLKEAKKNASAVDYLNNESELLLYLTSRILFNYLKKNKARITTYLPTNAEIYNKYMIYHWDELINILMPTVYSTIIKYHFWGYEECYRLLKDFQLAGILDEKPGPRLSQLQITFDTDLKWFADKKFVLIENINDLITF